MAAQALNNLAKAAVGIGAGASLFQASMYNVDGGSRAVMFNRLSGVQKKVMGEGTHFRLPWFQTPHIFDVRIRPRNISSNTGTKDLQVVTINLVRLKRECCVPAVWLLVTLLAALPAGYTACCCASLTHLRSCSSSFCVPAACAFAAGGGVPA